MKRIWFAVIIAVLIAAVCIYESLIIGNTATDLENKIDKVIEAVESGDIDIAVKYNEEIDAQWTSAQKAINCLMPHENTDEIYEGLNSFYILTKEGNSTQFHVSAEKLKLQLKVLKESGQAQIENIL